MILDIDGILFQRAGQFDAAARHGNGCAGCACNTASVAMFSEALATGLSLACDKTRLDRGLGARPAFEQAAFDQEQIGALAGSGHDSAAPRRGGLFGRHPHAGLERRQIVPDIRRFLFGRQQGAAMKIERVHHHQIVVQTKILDRQSVCTIDQAAKPSRDVTVVDRRTCGRRGRRRDRWNSRGTVFHVRPCSRVRTPFRDRRPVRETA